MKKLLLLWRIIFCALFVVTLLFCVPVYATEQEGEYLGTLKSGESISTRGLAYAVYQISATSIGETGGWCPNCFSGNSLTGIGGGAVTSTYSVLLDGYSILDYSSYSGGTGIIDLSSYSNHDAMLTLPEDYTLTQKVYCQGGTYADGSRKGACGYTTYNTITVSGTLQLYGYDKKPKLISNPRNISTETDKTATFSVTGEKVTGYQWQMLAGGNYIDIHDGSLSDGVILSGTSGSQLTVSNIRSSLNDTCFRCVLIGERGDRVTSEPASISVTDKSAPRVKLTYTPTENTSGNVTVLISATDADSGLADTPYHYKNGNYKDNYFNVSNNGTYEVSVSDRAGNVATMSITISNIVPKPTPTPTPTDTVRPPVTPTVTPTPIPAPTTVVTPTPTIISYTKPSSSSSKPSSTTEKEKTDGSSTEKKVNINKLNSSSNIAGKKDYDLNLDNEDTEKSEQIVEETEMLAEMPVNAVDAEVMENNDNTVIIVLSIGLFVLLLLILMALIFPVRIENSDELGSWHFCTVKMLSLSGGYSLHLGLLLEDFDSLRLHFGSLFMLMGKGKELVIILDGSERIVIDEITQDMIVDYGQVVRN